MTEQKINTALEELRKESGQLGDEESKEILDALADSIEQNVDYSGVSDEHQDLVEDVKDAITHFEVEHPQITGILNDIMMSLSNCGI